MSALERWNDMDAHGSHDPLIEDVLDAGNDLRDELLAEVERLKMCGSCQHCKTGASSGTRCYATTPYHNTYFSARTCLHDPSRWEVRVN